MLLDGQDIYAPDVDVVERATRVGMVFQRPNPFPKSIFDNVAYGPRLHRREGKELDEACRARLRRAALWDEVKDQPEAERARRSPADSSSACASPARWRSSPR